MKKKYVKETDELRPKKAIKIINEFDLIDDFGDGFIDEFVDEIDFDTTSDDDEFWDSFK
jgi:hypothetical protein